MKNPKIVVTDNRKECKQKRTEHLWKGQVWQKGFGLWPTKEYSWKELSKQFPNQNTELNE